jgi:NADPH:quinone reductase-like Zn-dependent oxidoreductase
MRALVASPTSPEHVELRGVPDPVPREDEALVGVRAISINRGEMHRLAQASDGARFGWDIAGVVERAAANGEGPREGARVVGFLPGGGWAERVAVPVGRLAELPDEVSFVAASTLPVAGLTALRTLRFGGMLVGKRVLITGAAGGVGHFAIQLASQAGAHVTGLVGSVERGEALPRLGARDVVVDPDDLAEGYDLVLESAGGTLLRCALEVVALEGIVVTFGNSSREETSFNVSNFYNRGARLIGFFLLAPWEVPGISADLAELLSLMAVDRLRSDIGYEGTWRQAAEALRALRERRVQGKAVLLVD